jgi:hypothetical protein
MEEVHLAQHPELRALMQMAQVGIHEFADLRSMDFHPLPERRLIIHLRGEVEIGVSDGSKQIFRPGDARLMENTFGRGHTHQDLSPVIQAVVVLKD